MRAKSGAPFTAQRQESLARQKATSPQLVQFNKWLGEIQGLMGLLHFLFHRVAAQTEYQLLTDQLSRHEAKGLNGVQAGALLLTERWKLPEADDTPARASLMSANMGDLLIGLIMFSKRIGAENATRSALIDDPFFNLHGCLYVTALPLTGFARNHMNAMRSEQRDHRVEASDAAFAAFYASMIAPCVLDAWIVLAQSRSLGFCPRIDQRDHVKDGINSARRFLETANNVDPEFRRLLNEGIRQLSTMEKR